MTKQIYLIRHGDIQYPLDKQGRKLVYGPDISLSPLGKLQIQKLSEKLKQEKVKIEALFVSPFRRTRQTAAILQSYLQIPELFIVDDLQDVNPNSWFGYPLEEHAKIQGDIYNHPKSTMQESLKHILMRAGKAIKHIINTNDFKSVAVVSHGDLISAIGWILKTPDKVPSYLEMKNRFYLQKGQAAIYTFNPSLKLTEEVRLITVDEVKQSLESFRGNNG